MVSGVSGATTSGVPVMAVPTTTSMWKPAKEVGPSRALTCTRAPLASSWRGAIRGDVEREVIADIGTECGTQSVNGVIDGGVGGIEEDVDILAVPSRGEAG